MRPLVELRCSVSIQISSPRLRLNLILQYFHIMPTLFCLHRLRCSCNHHRRWTSPSPSPSPLPHTQFYELDNAGDAAARYPIPHLPANAKYRTQRILRFASFAVPVWWLMGASRSRCCSSPERIWQLSRRRACWWRSADTPAIDGFVQRNVRS